MTPHAIDWAGHIDGLVQDCSNSIARTEVTAVLHKAIDMFLFLTWSVTASTFIMQEQSRIIWRRRLGLYSLSGKTSYRKISWSLEAARFGSKLFQSLWNLAGTSAALLSMCLSNFWAIRPLQHPISRLRDYTRFGGKTSYRLVNRGPESWVLSSHICQYPPFPVLGWIPVSINCWTWVSFSLLRWIPVSTNFLTWSMYVS